MLQLIFYYSNHLTISNRIPNCNLKLAITWEKNGGRGCLHRFAYYANPVNYIIFAILHKRQDNYIIICLSLSFNFEMDSIQIGKIKHSQNTENYHSQQQQLLKEIDKIRILEVPSEFNSQFYEPKVSLAQTCSILQIAQKLKENGILYESNKYVSFSKHCIKTDWESTSLLIHYGGFSAEVRIILVHSNHHLLNCQFIDKGSYGSVWKLQLHENQSYAIKNIQIKSNDSKSLDLAIKQVFMAKLFSALEIGPKFSQILSYDAIQYKNSVQFAMELCNTTYSLQSIQKEKHEQNLLVSLKKMHSLNICHRDIKLSNLGWSEKLQKFVFLDFNFSQVLQERLGFKTLTHYAGTFSYCSSEMKKLRLLETADFIDLYFNDLHCFEKMWEELINENQLSFKLKLYQATQISAYQIHLGEKNKEDNLAILRYFQMKLYYFNCDFESIKQLLQKQEVLIETSRRMLYSQYENRLIDNQTYLQLKAFWQQKIKKERAPSTGKRQNTHPIDLMLNLSEVTNCNKVQLNSLWTIMMRISQSKALFSQLWAEKIWQQRIFYFIDVYSNTAQSAAIQRKKMISAVYSHITGAYNDDYSPTLKLRQVLLYYFQLFYQCKNVAVMEKILSYFIIMDDRHNSEKMEDKILLSIQQAKNWVDYLTRNFKYFVCKAILPNKAGPTFSNKLIHNLQGLLQMMTSDESKQSECFPSSVTTTITLMNLMKKVHETGEDLNESNSGQFMTSMRKCLEDINEYLSADLKKFVKCLIMNKFFFAFHLLQNFDLFQFTGEYVFSDHLLEKYVFKMQIVYAIYTTKIAQLRNLLEGENFTKEFYILHHSPVLYAHEYEIKKQIYHDYIQIVNGVELSTNYLQAIIVFFELSEVQKLLLQFIEMFKLSQIENYEELINFEASMLTLLTALINLLKRKNADMQKQTSSNLLAIVYPFLQFSEKVWSQEKAAHESYLKRKKWEKIHQLFYVLMHEFGGEREKGLAILQDIIKARHRQILNEPIYIFVLCTLDNKASEKPQQKVLETISFISDLMIESQRFDVFFNEIDFFQKVMHIKVANSQFQDVVPFMYEFCRLIQTRKFNVLLTYLVQGIAEFANVLCPPIHLKSMVETYTYHKLGQIQCYSFFTYFLAQSYFRVTESKLYFDEKTKRRVLLVCAYFSEAFHQGIFTNYKNKLLKQLYQFGKLGLKKKIIQKRIHVSMKKLTQLLEGIPNKKYKNEVLLAFYRRQSSIQTLSQLRNRIKILQLNRKQK